MPRSFYGVVGPVYDACAPEGISRDVGCEPRRRCTCFAGIGAVGDPHTDVEDTEPTCICELDTQSGPDIASNLFGRIEEGIGGT